jgi:hypothetical protein
MGKIVYLEGLLRLHGLLVGGQVPEGGGRQASVRLLDTRQLVHSLRDLRYVRFHSLKSQEGARSKNME